MSESRRHGTGEPARGDQRQRESKIALSSSQRETIASIVQAIEQADDKKLLIFLEGVSGIGKSMIAPEIQKAIGKKKSIEVLHLEDRYRPSIEELKKSHGHILAIGTPSDVASGKEYSLSADKFPDRKRVSIILKAMNDAEIREYIKSLGNKRNPKLSLDEIVRYSLGVPLLAQRLTTEDIDVEDARLMASGFLRSLTLSHREEEEKKIPFGDYYSVTIPDSVREGISRYANDGKIYNTIDRVFSNLEALRARGSHEESPLFVAPESKAIYDSMLQRHVGFNTFLRIYAPHLSEDDFTRLEQGFGWNGSSYDFGREMMRHTDRAGAFQGTVRKTAIHARNRDIDRWDHEGHASLSHKRLSDEMENKFHTRKYPFKPQEGGADRSFHLSAWGHEGDNFNQTKLGWALESLLQHRGVAYIVENQPAGIWYVYNPQSKSIEPFTPPPYEK
ncbi:hypothetical protein HY622_02595 [Candidatus Uhrbacteria bacterium]|nr:hypothetical protein [Candidatus Uhrbacteria bacterium]